MHVVDVALQVPEMGDEYVIQARVQDVLDRPVRDLRREAVRALGAGHAVMGYLLGQPHLDPQRMEKPGVEGPQRIDGKGLGHSDREIALFDEFFLRRRALNEHELFALFYVVVYRRFIDLFLLPHVGVLVAAAAEHVLVAVHVQDAYRALVVARLAGELALVHDLRAEDLVHVIAALLNNPVMQLLLCQYPDAEAAKELGIGGYGDVLVQ